MQGRKKGRNSKPERQVTKWAGNTGRHKRKKKKREIMDSKKATVNKREKKGRGKKRKRERKVLTKEY